MTDRRESDREPIAAAIRERIRTLREELAHWEEMLRQCEDAPDQPDDAGNPSLHAKKCSTAR